MEENQKPPIVNCHTHIFTGTNIPPYIGKSYLWWPFYYAFNVPLILMVCKFWYTNKWSPNNWKYHSWFKKINKILSNYRAFINRQLITYIPATIFNTIISYHTFFILFKWINNIIKSSPNSSTFVDKILNYLTSHHLLYIPNIYLLKFLIVLFTFLFIANGRKLIIYVVKFIWSFLKFMPSKETLKFWSRYINIGRFAYYKKSGRIFLSLKNQYEVKTKFVLLPMDMEYMKAGKLITANNYKNQMEQLASIKNNKKNNSIVYPFIAIDPRREKVGDKDFFKWKNNNGTVELQDCFIKEYIEDKKFNGFKIYPALGYYPFDKNLLALWKYAADNGLPIMTHCIKGTIFYRGTKEKEWNAHPIFKESIGNKEFRNLLLPEIKNELFTLNFTHPLNYFCLLNELLLRKVVEQTNDQTIKDLFGYTNAETPLGFNLNNLKICFGHYGGTDEWKKYFENDRDSITSKILTNKTGINIINEGTIENSYGTLEKIWKGVDWYSIISTMMLQYPNVYADISYIVHDTEIVPLLKSTLQNENLKTKVLYGTDFYVVRNYKSEKEIFADLQSKLTTDELDLITRYNPQKYLSIK